jgi:succinyl-CoA synthetase alpha subunit
MTILLTPQTKVIVQGITGNQGTFHTKTMRDYGTMVVAGTSPGRQGEYVHSVPVYDSIKQAQKEHDPNASIIFVPGPYVSMAAFEAIDAGIKLIVIITEHVPVWDTGEIIERAKQNGTIIVGPNCPGLISPGIAKLGIIPGHICLPGHVGIISRSGTLTYEVIQQLTRAKIGQSTCIGIGGDPIHGIGFCEALQLFENDPNTHAIVLIGEIGGTEEEEAALYIQNHIDKPVIAYIAGRTAPVGKQMGHAGAIVTEGKGTAISKVSAFEHAHIPVVMKPAEISPLILEKLGKY